MTQKQHCEGAERRLTVDAATVGRWLVTVFGAAAGTEALHHAFVREHDGNSLAAQFFIEVYRVVVERGGR
jgi:hypothetical protein